MSRAQLETAYGLASRFNENPTNVIKGLQNRDSLRQAFRNGLDVIINPGAYSSSNQTQPIAANLVGELASYFHGAEAGKIAYNQTLDAYNNFANGYTSVAGDNYALDTQGNLIPTGQARGVSDGSQAALSQGNAFGRAIGKGVGILAGTGDVVNYIGENIESRPLLKYGLLTIDIAAGPIAYGVRAGATAAFGDQINQGLAFIGEKSATTLIAANINPSVAQRATIGAGSLVGVALLGRNFINKIDDIELGFKFGIAKSKPRAITDSATSKQAFRKAKDANGIPRSQQPSRTIKPGTELGDRFGLDNRNSALFEFENSFGEKVHIRLDKPVPAGHPSGPQGPHFNAGPASDHKLRQHHNFGSSGN